MEIASKYDPKEVESKWYEYWLEHKLFSSTPDEREPYTVVIPPPNVTGVLHMGHMLNNTIQDILVRHARQQGKNACWVPGTDHASIATEAKVVNRLAQQGIKKDDLTRDEFLKHAWEWTDEHGGIILKQLRKLGASCDWDRTAFTMDETRSESVLKVFVDLYKKGMIYRGVRMVNWDPSALTALSDEEVIHKEENGKLYYLRYRVEGDEDTYAVVATTRPETIMGDTAMCINPEDPKNAHLKGKKVIVPLVNRVIPVIEDTYVDIEFGTGCLKVTPAHDVNDYMLGEKYNLQSIDIFNDNGTIADGVGLYEGMDRFEVRKQIVKDLEAADLLEKVEDYTNKVGYSERTNVVIEPKLSMQWFLKMDHLADIALEPVMEDAIRFFPAKYKNTYRHWLENIKDWCISRQLWWGHRIPAYFLPEGGYVVAETAEEALVQAREKTGNADLKMEDLRQDEDCLDTWFSSWLWPISLFNGILDPKNKEMEYYYPTADLVTGPDIIFFWVARMIMAGYEYEKDMPFKNVYFTGIVRDGQGRKMSKSLGNSPDPLDLIDKYSADGVRMGMMLAAPAGNDILFDEALCEQGRNFNNKIWNSFRLVKGWEVSEDIEMPKSSELTLEWFDALLENTRVELEDLYSKYRLSEALMLVYKLFTDDFSGWVLEVVKPAFVRVDPTTGEALKEPYQLPIDAATYNKVLDYFDQLLSMLHPFMPFITEELWHALQPREEGQSIMFQMAKEATMTAERQAEIIKNFDTMKEVVSGIRNVRTKRNIPQKEALSLQHQATELAAHVDAYKSVISKVCNLSEITVVETLEDGAATFMVGTTEFAIPLGGFIDAEAEIARMEKELKAKRGFLNGIMKKLSNERFVANAPEKVIALEKKKQADSEAIIASLEEAIAKLKG